MKPAAPPVMAAGVYAGTTLADDGRPILVLDPSGIAKAARLRSEAQDAVPAAAADGREARAGDARCCCSATLDGAVRAVPVPLVERIEDVPATAIRRSAGRLRVVARRPDRRRLPAAPKPPAEGKLRILRLTDGAAEIAYAFARGDRHPRARWRRRQPAAVPGEVAGVLLVDGLQVELLDAHWLFASSCRRRGRRRAAGLRAAGRRSLDRDHAPAAARRPRLPDRGGRARGSPPISSSPGRTMREAPAVAGAEVVRLRASPEPAGEDDSSIYRYDRAALLSALGAAGGRRHG